MKELVCLMSMKDTTFVVENLPTVNTPASMACLVNSTMSLRGRTPLSSCSLDDT